MIRPDSVVSVRPRTLTKEFSEGTSLSLLRMQANQSGHRARYLVWCNILSAASHDT